MIHITYMGQLPDTSGLITY